MTQETFTNESGDNRVLVVDDDETFLFAMRKAFKKSSFRVDTANSAKKAISLLKKFQYKILVTDLNIDEHRDISCQEIICIARQQRKDIAIILCSALIDLHGKKNNKDDLQLCALKPDYYFEKPVSISFLEEIIEACLQRRSS